MGTQTMVCEGALDPGPAWEGLPGVATLSAVKSIAVAIYLLGTEW